MDTDIFKKMIGVNVELISDMYALFQLEFKELVDKTLINAKTDVEKAIRARQSILARYARKMLDVYATSKG